MPKCEFSMFYAPDFSRVAAFFQKISVLDMCSYFYPGLCIFQKIAFFFLKEKKRGLLRVFTV